MIHPSPTSSRSRRRGRTSLWLRLQGNIPLALVALMAVLVPLLPGPSAAAPWDGASGVALEVGGILLLAAALARADGPGLSRLWAFARRGPTPWLLALAVGGALSWAVAPGVATLQGLLQLASGVLVYATVAYRVRQRDDYRFFLDVLIASTILMSLLGIGGLILTGSMAAGVLFSHRAFGAFLMLMLPALLLPALDPAASSRRTAAQTAAAMAALALLLARWMPAWRGEAVALLVLVLLGARLGLLPGLNAARLAALRRRPEGRDSRSRRHGSRPRRHGSRSGRSSSRRATGDVRSQAVPYIIYGAVLLVAVALFLSMTHTSALVTRQFRPLLASASSAPRQIWRGVSAASAGAHSGDSPDGKRNTRAVLAMVQARPLRGWGIGSYPVYQSRFTHQGDSAEAVRRSGPQPLDRPRTLYLQLAAELGLPGLALWTGALALFFIRGVRALPRLGETPLRQRLLVGCLAAVAGQVVDAFSDSSWQYGGVSLSLWLLLGLGMAAAGLGENLPAEAAVAGEAAAVARPATAAYLRFAAACIVSAVLLSQVMRVVR